MNTSCGNGMIAVATNGIPTISNVFTNNQNQNKNTNTTTAPLNSSSSLPHPQMAKAFSSPAKDVNPFANKVMSVQSKGFVPSNAAAMTPSGGSAAAQQNCQSSSTLSPIKTTVNHF